MNQWLLAPETFARMDEAWRRLDASAIAAAHADELARVEAREGGASPAGLSIVRGSAEIRVEGVLTKKPDWFARFFGGGNTAYTDLRRALAVAAGDPTVKTITLAIDSPGGAVDGLFETLDAIAAVRASGKTLRVRGENALSAAYAIAAAAGTIEAVSRGSLFGSVGTVASFFVSPNIVHVTNSESPSKRPDVTTEEGKAEVVKFLDQAHDEFVRSIAKGRGTSAKLVTETFGRGASFMAANALALGMIDRISPPPRAVTSKGKAMGASAEENEDARASAASIEAAVQRGVTQERDRVLAHLTMGEQCGAMSTALEAIRAGTGMTMELNARYITAGINRSDSSKRQTESNAAGAVVDGAGTSPAAAGPDLGDQVVSILKNNAAGSFVRG